MATMSGSNSGGGFLTKLAVIGGTIATIIAGALGFAGQQANQNANTAANANAANGANAIMHPGVTTGKQIHIGAGEIQDMNRQLAKRGTQIEAVTEGGFQVRQKVESGEVVIPVESVRRSGSSGDVTITAKGEGIEVTITGHQDGRAGDDGDGDMKYDSNTRSNGANKGGMLPQQPGGFMASQRDWQRSVVSTTRGGAMRS